MIKEADKRADDENESEESDVDELPDIEFPVCIGQSN